MSWRSNNERRRLELAEAIRERPLISRTLTMPNGRRTTIDADSFAEFNELLELAEALAAGGLGRDRGRPSLRRRATANSKVVGRGRSRP